MGAVSATMGPCGPVSCRAYADLTQWQQNKKALSLLLKLPTLRDIVIKDLPYLIAP